MVVSILEIITLFFITTLPFVVFIWFLPFNQMIRFAAVFLSFASIFFTLLNQTQIDGPGGGLGLAFIGFFILFHCAFIVIALMVWLIRLFTSSEKKRTYLLRRLRLRSSSMDPLLACFFGFWTATGAAYLIKAFYIPLIPDHWVHPLYFGCLILLAILYNCSKEPRKKPLKFYAISALITACLWGLYSLYYPYLIHQKAKEIAKSTPYCLFNPLTKQAVNSHNELSFLTMPISYYQRVRIFIPSKPRNIYVWSYSKDHFNSYKSHQDQTKFLMLF